MLIDWFTVSAQVLNFLILVWLLKRFLYKPILQAIDAREKRIAAQLADADARRAGAQEERAEFRHKNEEFERKRADLLRRTQDEVKAERQRLLDEARQAADALRAERQGALEREQQSLGHEITRRTREEVFAIARKTLADLAGTALEERMSDVFVERLRELEGEAREELAKALATAADPAVVRSASELPAKHRAAIQKALDETFAAEVQVRFETVPDVIGGVELIVNGRKIAWSIADHLASLGRSVDDLLKEQSTPPGKTKAEILSEPEAPEHETAQP
jgi:F-type H+-transporting ATPase subunit b